MDDEEEIGHAKYDASAEHKEVRLGSDGELLCPECSNPNLHQVMVESVFRFTEDGTGLATMHDDENNSSVRPMPAKHISGRRNNAYVYFVCEHGCSDTHVMGIRIQQHKGTTYLKWLVSEMDEPFNASGQVH